MTDINQEPFITMAALRKQRFPEPDWIVDGLLRTGLRRPALLAGKPEAGKSTLARQLAVAVSQGIPFLGRTTKLGAVLYWQTEDEVSDVSRALNRLGSKEGDLNIHVFQGDPGSSGCEGIAKLLKKDEEIKLVIIETLDDLLKMNDIKENTAARQAFEKLTSQLIIPFGHRASFLALHHLKKVETDFAGDGLLGASVIRGRTDAKIYLAQAGPEDQRRTICATVRGGGCGIPKRFLMFDPSTGVAGLGETIADARQRAEREGQEAEKARLFDVIRRQPDVAHRELLNSLSGGFKKRSALINEAVQEGSIVRSGNGVKGSPLTYTMVAEVGEPSSSDPGLTCQTSVEPILVPMEITSGCMAQHMEE